MNIRFYFVLYSHFQARHPMQRVSRQSPGNSSSAVRTRLHVSPVCHQVVFLCRWQWFSILTVIFNNSGLGVIPFIQYIRWLPPTNGSYRVQHGEKQCPVCRARIEKVSQAYISWSSIQSLSQNTFKALKTCDNQPLDLTIIEHHLVLEDSNVSVHLKDKVIWAICSTFQKVELVLEIL